MTDRGRTDVSVRLPNFLFIGPDKGGSTWLQATLSTHPQVYLPRAKDTYFFGSAHTRGLDWYAGHFDRVEPRHTAVGEICHDYLYDAAAPARIKQVLPDATLLACLREPCDRAFSSYLNMRRNGWDVGPFRDAVAGIPELLDHSRYGRHLRTFYEAFPTSQIQLLWFDELEADPQTFLDGVTDRLGVERLVLSDDERLPARPAAEARSRLLARAVKGAAATARSLGWADRIGRVKSRPVVQKLLYRPFAGDRPVLGDDDRALVRSLLADDVRDLSVLIGTDVAARWGWRR